MMLSKMAKLQTFNYQERTKIYQNEQELDKQLAKPNQAFDNMRIEGKPEAES